MSNKTVISVSSPAPKWATWLFRIEFFANKAFLLWLAATKIITPDNIQEILVAAVAIDTFIWGLGRGLGVKKDDFDTDNPN